MSRNLTPADFTGWKFYEPRGGMWSATVNHIEDHQEWALIHTTFDEDWDVYVAGTHWRSHSTESEARRTMDEILNMLRQGRLSI